MSNDTLISLAVTFPTMWLGVSLEGQRKRVLQSDYSRENVEVVESKNGGLIKTCKSTNYSTDCRDRKTSFPARVFAEFSAD